MDAPNRRNLLLHHQPGDGFIRLHHEHFDNGVAEARVLGMRIGHLPVIIENQVDGGQIQHDHTLPHPAALNRTGQRVHVLDQLHHGLPQAARIAFKDRRRLVVGKPLRGLDHGIGKAGSDHAPALVVPDEDALRQARFVLLQAAQTIAQHLGKHRNDMPGEIHARATGFRLDIDRRARHHKRTDIGNMNAQLPRRCLLSALLEATKRDRVVVVPRVVGIDGDHFPVEQRFAFRRCGIGIEPFDEVTGLPGDLLRKLVGQMKLVNDRLQVHALAPAFPQALGHHAARGTPIAGILGDFHHHEISRPGGFRSRVANENRRM